MSGERWPREMWLDAVYASELPAPARHVAMVLAHHARDSDRVFMGYAKLRDFTGLSRSTVVRAVGVLVQERFLEVVGHGTPKRAARYRIATPGVVTATTGVWSEGLHGVVTTTTPVVTATTGGVRPDYRGVVTESTDLTNSEKSSSTDANEVVDMRKTDRADPLDDAAAVWSETHPGREREALAAALAIEQRRGVTVSHPARYFATWDRARRAGVTLPKGERPPCPDCVDGWLLDDKTRLPAAPCPTCKTSTRRRSATG